MIINKINIKKGSLICLFFIVSLWSCAPEQTRLTTIEGNALGTTYHVTFLGNHASPTIQGGFDSILSVVNLGLSTYTEASIISKFNHNNLSLWNASTDSAWYDALKHFRYMISASMIISARTNGAFDPGAAPQFALYAYSKKAGIHIDTLVMDSVKQHCGIHLVDTTSDLIPQKRDSAVQLNFNAIAKGYTVDLFAEYLDHLGIENYLVEIGGEVRVRGDKNGKPWVLGINTPVEQSGVNDLYDGIELTTGSMATSGNYQNFYYVDGQLIGHTFDPRIGRPVVSNLKSATVFHPNCATADAYATACMVMGLHEAIDLIKGDTSLSAYFIYEENGGLKSKRVE